MKKNTLCMLLLMAAAVSAGCLYAQEDTTGTVGEEMKASQENNVGVGGVVDVAHAEGKTALNANTLGDNNFNNIRALINFQFQHKDKIRADVEVLFDDASRDRVRLQGAFVTLFNLPNESINLMVGKIPNLFGNFAKREFSDINPLIGQPLMRQYRTSLDWNNIWNNREQLILKQRRLENRGALPYAVLKGATPTVYDARWDFGVELFGSASILEYQLGVTEGSISNPEANENKGKQFLGRIGIDPSPGLKIGFSAAVNPYLSAADPQRLLEAGKGKDQYRQKAFGADLEASYRYVIVFSEFVRSQWDAAVREGKLSNWSWYVDAKYKILPQFYVAARFDMMNFSKITNPSNGQKETWDFNVKRYEGGLGFRITAEATLKVTEQWTMFEKNSGIRTVRLTAMQLSVPF
jgi:hypothetical protein